MDEMMMEILAECERVNKLNVEVDRAIQTKTTAVEAVRKDIWKEIRDFLWQMNDLLAKAGCHYGVVVKTNLHYINDNRVIGIMFFGSAKYEDFAQVGRYYTYEDSYSHKICDGVSEFLKVATDTGLRNYGIGVQMQTALIRLWSDDAEKVKAYIKQGVMAKAKEILASRTEQMQKDLKKANDRYNVYVKGE